MADNTVLNAGTGGDTVATDDIGGVKHQLVKMEYGAADSATQVSSANPLPTVQTGALPAGANAIGTVDTELPAAAALADGAANPTTPTVGAGVLLWNGTTWDRAPGGATNGITANLKALNGTTIATNSGTKDAGTQRVVIATDQVQLTNALKVDGSAVTQPVSGTVTANLGTAAVTNAGTFAVQADTELTTADLDTGAGTDTRAVVGLVIAKSGGAANISNTDPVPVSDAGGSLTVDNGGTFAVQIAANSSVNQAQIAGTTTDTNSGTKSAGTQRVVLATDQPALTNALKVDGSAVTQPVSGTVTANLGTAAVTNAGTFAVQDSQVIADDAAFTVATSKVFAAGFLADETATDSVDEGDAGAARMTLDRKLIVTVEPHTAGGWDTKNCTSGDGSTALTNSAQAVKASAGKLGGWFIYNPNSSATYVPIYNVASGSVTVGTTNPLMVLTIPATSAANLEMVNGITFDTAIAVAAAATAGGNSAPTTALEANFFYK